MTDDLRQEVDRLRERVAELETHLDEQGTSNATGTIDRYDGTVLDQLEEGATYRLDELRRAYKQAGIRNDSTLKERIRHLTTTYCEQAAARRWRFTGGDGE